MEVLVADDGSGPATAKLVEDLAVSIPCELRRVWHADEGFRLAAIRNRAIRQSRGEIIVFIDGDSLLYPRTLALHARRCRPGRAHTGERCYLDERRSELVLEGSLDPRDLAQEARKRARPRLWRRFARNAFHRLTRLKPRPKLLGGNCAVHRSDLERVNGFDERFVGWGLEDDDLLRRLRRIGVRIGDGSLDCLVLHLFHPIHESHAPSVHHTRNYEYFHRGFFLTRCRHGIRERALEEVSFRFVDALPPRLRELPARLGSSEDGERAEVSLRASGRGGRRKRVGGCEVELELGEDVIEAGDPVAAALRFLEEAL